MAALEDHISTVNNKLQQLLREYERLKKENEKLRLAVTGLQLKREMELRQISQLQQQVHILQSSSGRMAEPDKMAFEKQINQYIKEIDTCIALLSE